MCYFGVTGHIFVCKAHFIFYSDGMDWNDGMVGWNIK